jgi:hypothetical protein
MIHSQLTIPVLAAPHLALIAECADLLAVTRAGSAPVALAQHRTVLVAEVESKAKAAGLQPRAGAQSQMAIPESVALHSLPFPPMRSD